MLDVFFVTFPFFFLVFAGYFAVSKGLLTVSAVPGLNSFVLYFALPCMCFRFGSETSVTKILDPVVFGVYLASALITVFVCIVITKRGQIGWSDASLGALVAAWPNTGFMGVPMLATLLGTASVGPVMLTMLIDVFVPVLYASVCHDWILRGWTAWEEHFVRLSRVLRAIPCPGPFCLESWSVSLILNCGCLLTKPSTCSLMPPHRRRYLRLVQCWHGQK